MNYYNCCIIFIFSRLYVIFDPICNIVIYFLLVLNFAIVICVLSIKVKKKNNNNNNNDDDDDGYGLRDQIKVIIRKKF